MIANANGNWDNTGGYWPEYSPYPWEPNFVPSVPTTIPVIYPTIVVYPNLVTKNITPHKCPVCEGRGKVDKGFYRDEPSVDKCKTCSGVGVLWG